MTSHLPLQGLLPVCKGDGALHSHEISVHCNCLFSSHALPTLELLYMLSMCAMSLPWAVWLLMRVLAGNVLSQVVAFRSSTGIAFSPLQAFWAAQPWDKSQGIHMHYLQLLFLAF